MAVRGAMYPLNPPFNLLSQLLRVFKSPEELKKCVRHQLIGGAKVALAFMRVHNPSLSFRDLHMLPSTVDDRVNFLPDYAEVEKSAEMIIDASNAETERLLRQPRSNPR